MTQPLLFAIVDGLAHIRLNRPGVLNALNQPMADVLLEACHTIEATPAIRAVLITGEGRAFMAGGDITLFKGDNATKAIDTLMRALHDAIIILARLKAPVVSLAHGMVAGAGVSFALAADVVLAADDAKFLLAYSKLGANPDGGSTYQLPRAIGLRRALGFALLEETMDAATAERTGLVNRLLPAATAQADALAVARRLASGPTAAFARTKSLLRASLDRDLPTQLDAERAEFLAGTFTADFAEGVDAFLGKRPARFSGA
jgi:2-(1,2-epoxy-1,2-dihydrophenyl)acetyl-CoA isomerase